MSQKNETRLRRAKATRSHIRKLAVPRLTVHRSDQHIYAQVISAEGDKVLAAASTVQKAVADESERHEKQGGRRCGRQGGRRESQGGRREKRCVRSLRFPLSRPYRGAGGCGARSGSEVLR